MHDCLTWSSRESHCDTLHYFRMDKESKIATTTRFLPRHPCHDGEERIEVTLNKERILIAGLVVRREDTRLPEYVMFEEPVENVAPSKRQGKE